MYYVYVVYRLFVNKRILNLPALESILYNEITPTKSIVIKL